ncbi:MAG TPA: putative zinc-binding metallopeptidase, partial [Candidatus Saccharimonadia bacterium]|nr:putative zinc-binding metallopeptidase [Candidatus Saccharimonadia bacterium]
MKRFSCECGNVLFFENSQCLQCGSQTGYDPSTCDMVKLTRQSGLKRCDNGVAHGICNWLLPAKEAQTLCTACRLNRTIPDLNMYGNLALWARMESAKRRLLATLLGLGIKVPCFNEDPVGGLAFDFLQTLSNPPVTTGYMAGVITVNLQEADDAVRERTRQQLGESSRTLLGHFRHETGHYFWERWFGILPFNHPLRMAFGELFGDAGIDYVSSMNRHYSQGPPQGWEQSYISAYASMHPWEDWAET